MMLKKVNLRPDVMFLRDCKWNNSVDLLQKSYGSQSYLQKKRE